MPDLTENLPPEDAAFIAAVTGQPAPADAALARANNPDAKGYAPRARIRAAELKPADKILLGAQEYTVEWVEDGGRVVRFRCKETGNKPYAYAKDTELFVKRPGQYKHVRIPAGPGGTNSGVYALARGSVREALDLAVARGTSKKDNPFPPGSKNAAEWDRLAEKNEEGEGEGEEKDEDFEKKHPRHPEGTRAGGKFAPKGSGGEGKEGEGGTRTTRDAERERVRTTDSAGRRPAPGATRAPAPTSSSSSGGTQTETVRKVQTDSDSSSSSSSAGGGGGAKARKVAERVAGGKGRRKSKKGAPAKVRANAARIGQRVRASLSSPLLQALAAEAVDLRAGGDHWRRQPRDGEGKWVESGGTAAFYAGKAAAQALRFAEADRRNAAAASGPDPEFRNSTRPDPRASSMPEAMRRRALTDSKYERQRRGAGKGLSPAELGILAGREENRAAERRQPSWATAPISSVYTKKARQLEPGDTFATRKENQAEQVRNVTTATPVTRIQTESGKVVELHQEEAVKVPPPAATPRTDTGFLKNPGKTGQYPGHTAAPTPGGGTSNSPLPGGDRGPIFQRTRVYRPDGTYEMWGDPEAAPGARRRPDGSWVMPAPKGNGASGPDPAASGPAPRTPPKAKRLKRAPAAASTARPKYSSGGYLTLPSRYGDDREYLVDRALTAEEHYRDWERGGMPRSEGYLTDWSSGRQEKYYPNEPVYHIRPWVVDETGQGDWEDGQEVPESEFEKMLGRASRSTYRKGRREPGGVPQGRIRYR